MEFVCKKCSKSKDIGQFIKNKASKSGIVLTCRECSVRIKREYYLNNKDRMLNYFKNRYLCKKEQIKACRDKYNSTKHGKIMQIIQNIRKRCDDPKNKRYHRYGGRGIKNLLSYDDISKIWDRDNACAMKVPSLDRVNVNGNYEFDNCQFIEMSDNRKKDSVRKVNQMSIDGVIIKTFSSIISATKDGFQRPNIIKCCKGDRNTHKGFKWGYC